MTDYDYKNNMVFIKRFSLKNHIYIKSKFADEFCCFIVVHVLLIDKEVFFIIIQLNQFLCKCF